LQLLVRDTGIYAPHEDSPRILFFAVFRHTDNEDDVSSLLLACQCETTCMEPACMSAWGRCNSPLRHSGSASHIQNRVRRPQHSLYPSFCTACQPMSHSWQKGSLCIRTQDTVHMALQLEVSLNTGREVALSRHWLNVAGATSDVHTVRGRLSGLLALAPPRRARTRVIIKLYLCANI
jgi:hypothetical protein